LVNLFKGCGCGQRPQILYAIANFDSQTALPFGGLNTMAKANATATEKRYSTQTALLFAPDNLM